MNRVAVVTGAARGIGYAISKKLVETGWKVAACDILEEDLKAAAKELGDAFHPWTVNITDEEAVKCTAAEIEEKLGPVFGLVNNAGITRDGLIMRMQKEDWDSVLAVNLTGAFLMCREALRAPPWTGGRDRRT